MKNWEDEMTSKERMTRYFQGKEVDRLPFSIFLGEPAAKFINSATYDFYHKADVIVDVELFCFERFGQDGVSAGVGLHGFAEAMGSKLHFPKEGLASVEAPFLAIEENHNRLEPADPYKDGRLRVLLEALEKLQYKVGDIVGVGAGITGPFTTLSSLRGPEKLMKDLYNEPEKVFNWLDIIMETTNAYIDEASKFNVSFSIADPISSCSLISPKIFKKFVKPYLKKCSDRIIEKSGTPPSLHICGKTETILQDMVDTGIGSLSVDNVVDMKKAKEQVGNQVCLVGNVKPIDTILNGTKEDIFSEVKDLVYNLHDNPKGYIIAPGCQIPMNIPIEKVDMYVEAARKYGRFSIVK